jgi:cytochrome c oxidase assembly protein Cox11
VCVCVYVSVSLSLSCLQLLFYIDPEFAKDPNMRNVKSLTLSYTFFRTKTPDEESVVSEVSVPAPQTAK